MLDLEHPRATWSQVSRRQTEDFSRQLPPERGAWPDDYATQLGITTTWDSLKETPNSAYMFNHRAASHLMALKTTAKLFGIQQTDIGKAREMVAKCPELGLANAEAMEVWTWAEQTSGLYVTTEEGEMRQRQLQTARMFLTNMVFKLKEAIRQDSQTHGPTEPVLDIRALQEHMLDIAYDTTWQRGSTSYLKKNITTAKAKTFAVEVAKDPIDPYTLAGRCPACDHTVVPGNLGEHLTTCISVRPQGHVKPCPQCPNQYRTIQALTQHRALHCRGAQQVCKGCRQKPRCECNHRRERLCTRITELIREATMESPLHIDHIITTQLNDLAIHEILEVATEDNAPEGMEPTTVEAMTAAHSDQVARQRMQEEEKDTHQCQWCTLAFASEQQLTDHKDQYHSLGCAHCAEAFPTQAQLTSHEAEHRAENQCPRCLEEFNSLEDLEEHGEQYHYPCNYCDQWYDTLAENQKHTIEKHTRMKVELKCPKCPATFRYNKDRKEHEATHGQKEKIDPCKDCHATFRSTGELDNHRKTCRADEEAPYQCHKCDTTWRSPVELVEHDRRTHTKDGGEPIPCLICEMVTPEAEYSEHLRTHTDLWGWQRKGLPCPKCDVRPTSIAGLLDHIKNLHKVRLQTFITTIRREAQSEEYTEDSKPDQVSKAIRHYLGDQEVHRCTFKGCKREFATMKDLKRHAELEHRCRAGLCSYVGTSEEDLQEHNVIAHPTAVINTVAGHKGDSATRHAKYSCEKCGTMLSSIQELLAHKTTHMKFACGRCQERFMSNMAANKHEITCTTTTGLDVFAAARSTDPMMVMMHGLGQVVQSLEKAPGGGIMGTTATLLKEQLAKAQNTHSQKRIDEKNHHQQRTFTYIKPPQFGENNNQTKYNFKDISELQGKEFAGNKGPEDNFSELKELTTTLGRIIKSRSITKDVATELLIQHLKSPAKCFIASYVEDYQMKYGETAIPEFDDILIYLESRFVGIQPTDAKAQLNTLKKQANESPGDFFLRAWKASHFASFCSPEADRYTYRTEAVRDCILRNLGGKQREIIDEEELARTLKGEDKMGPREMVEMLANLSQRRAALNEDKRKPDFTTLGDMEAKVRRVQAADKPQGMRERTHQPPRQRGRNGRQTQRGSTRDYQPTRPQPPRPHYTRVNYVDTTPETHTVKREKDRAWTVMAQALVGKDACFKCARTNHNSKDCRTYKMVTKTPCQSCHKAYHNTKACKVGNTGQVTQSNRGTPNRGGSTPFRSAQRGRGTTRGGTYQNSATRGIGTARDYQNRGNTRGQRGFGSYTRGTPRGGSTRYTWKNRGTGGARGGYQRGRGTTRTSGANSVPRGQYNAPPPNVKREPVTRNNRVESREDPAAAFLAALSRE